MPETRKKILEFLRYHGQATVEILAEEVALTSMAVRHHLNILQADNLIEVAHARRDNRPGRPVQIYSLTDQARCACPQEYFQLTDILLVEMMDRIGGEEMATIFQNMANRIVANSPSPQDEQSFEDRLDQVIAFLRQRGFIVEWGQQEGQYIIRHLACPYRQLAKQHHQVCLLDEKIIESMLPVKPVRLACIANDDQECVYYLHKSELSLK